MISKKYHRFMRRLHTWRTASYAELNELYIAMLVRGISLSMIGLFVPIYLYNLGFGLTNILVVLTIYFAVRVVCDVLAAYGVAYFGPKHVMFFGQIVFAVSSALFLTEQAYSWPLWLLGGVWGASQSCFFMSFDVDFSKIKHVQHGGTELGLAEILGKLGALLGPLLGGIISITLGPRYIFAVSTALLLGGLLPLFKTREPVRLRQKLHFASFPLRRTLRLMPSITALHVENNISVTLWPLYLAIFVVPGTTVYVRVAAIATISMLVAMAATYLAGSVTDDGKGRQLLRISALGNAALHLVRPLVRNFGMAIGLDVCNQVVTAGYRIPFMKAHYDEADTLPGHRIVYICISECLSSIIKALIYASLTVLSTAYTGRSVLAIAFVVAAVASLIIPLERFTSFRKTNARA